jgi:cell volume regulation protein A
MELTYHIITIVGLLFVFSIVAGGLSPRLGVPTLVIFLCIGMLAGEDGPLGIIYNDVQSAHLVSTLALAVILFDGGLRTDLASFRSGLRPALLLSTIGVVLTAGLTGLAAIYLLGLPPLEAFLLGSLVSSTDAAAVFSLLKQANLSLHPRIGSTLEIESGSNDPMAVFLTIVLLEAVMADQAPGFGIALMFVQQMGLGFLGGVAGGYLLTHALNKLRLGSALYPLLALFGGVLIFGVISEIGGSGFLAVYLAGLYAGNARTRAMNAILGFHDGMAWLAQIGLFLILGLLVTPSDMFGYAAPAVGVALLLILLVRPITVFLCLSLLRFNWRELAYISWVGLRGAVPIVLAMFPLLAGIEAAPLMFNIAFVVVLVSLLVQGSTVAPMARWLRLDIGETGPSLKQRQRVALDVPGQINYEIVGYRLSSDSTAAGQTIASLPLPGSSRIIGVLRRGALAPESGRLRLRADDFIYVVTPFKYVERLDQLFLSTEQGRRQHRVSGDFDVSGQAPLADLLQLLGLDARHVEHDETVRSLFAQRFDEISTGDSIELGDDFRITAEKIGESGVDSARVRDITRETSDADNSDDPAAQ